MLDLLFNLLPHTRFAAQFPLGGGGLLGQVVLDEGFPRLALFALLRVRVLLVGVLGPAHLGLGSALVLLVLEVDAIQLWVHGRLFGRAQIPVHLGVLLDVDGTAVPGVFHHLVALNVGLLWLAVLHHHVVGLPGLVVLPLGSTRAHVLRRDVDVQDVLLVGWALHLLSELIGHSVDGELWRCLAELLRKKPLHLLRSQRAKSLGQETLGRAHAQKGIVLLEQCSLLLEKLLLLELLLLLKQVLGLELLVVAAEG